MMFKRYGLVLAVGLSSLFGLGGCVGYDGSADGASSHAQGLGVTSAEESSILGALAQKPMTTEELAEMTAEIERGERGFDGEMRTQTLAQRATGRRKPKGAQCAGDINCESTHCSQEGVCVAKQGRLPAGKSCNGDWNCQSHHCGSVEGKCVDAPLTDYNGVKDNDETDVDCGGTSPYACAVREACLYDDDCVAGQCRPEAGGASKCALVGTGTQDIGRFWPRVNNSGEVVPYAASVGLTKELGRDAQIASVNGAPTVRDKSGNAVAAEKSMEFQHMTCISHLIANGCSTASLQVRTHKAAYEYVACPQSARSAIGIVANSERSSGEFMDESARAAASLSDDPYLCNHSFTRGVRAVSFSPPSYRPSTGLYAVESQTYPGRPTVAVGVWDGLQVSVYRETLAATPENAKGGFLWFKQLQEYLLSNVACSQGRVWVDGIRNGAIPSSVASFNINQFCLSRTPFGSSAATDRPSFDLTGLQLAFVKSNVSWWGTLDIYSIDPEGNPNKPANRNLQYGWDAMHPSYSFGAYAASWRVTGLTRGTYKDTIAYGTGTGASFTPFNMGW